MDRNLAESPDLTLTRRVEGRIIPLKMTTQRDNRIARPRAIAKAAPVRSGLRAWCAARPAMLHALTTVVMIPWSIYCCFTNSRTGPKRRT